MPLCQCPCRQPVAPGVKFRHGHHMRVRPVPYGQIRRAQANRVAGLRAQWRAKLAAEFGPLTDRELDIARAIHRRSHQLGYLKGWRAASRDVRKVAA